MGLIISARQDHTHWRNAFVRCPVVSLDNVVQHQVMEAQEGPDGYVVRYVLDEAGRPRIMAGEFVTERLTGNVEFDGVRWPK